MKKRNTICVSRRRRNDAPAFIYRDADFGGLLKGIINESVVSEKSHNANDGKDFRFQQWMEGLRSLVKRANNNLLEGRYSEANKNLNDVYGNAVDLSIMQKKINPDNATSLRALSNIRKLVNSILKFTVNMQNFDGGNRF